MKNIVLIVFFCLVSVAAFSQDIFVELKEAANLERQLKDVEALAKYKEILNATPHNIMVLDKCTEIICNIGDRQLKKNDKQTNYGDALGYARQAFVVDSTSAVANYDMALVTGKMLEFETDNKKVLEMRREVKMYTDKALAVNATYARANFLEGKWNYDIVTLPPVKLAELKAFHKGFDYVDIDSAIIYMEKCRAAEEYFAPNYLALAKAYKFKKRPAQAVAVLEKLVKLPNRTPNDAAIKAEGQQMLAEME